MRTGRKRGQEFIGRGETLVEPGVTSAEDFVQIFGDGAVQIAGQIGAGGSFAGEHFVEDDAAGVEIGAGLRLAPLRCSGAM